MKTKRNKLIKSNKTKKMVYTKDCINPELHKKIFYHPIEDQLTTIPIKTGYEKNLIKIFNTPFAPSKYNPRNDFYNYINYTWIQNQTQIISKKKKFYTQVDSFRIVQEKVYYELMDIVKDFIKKNDSKKAKEIKNIYESFLHLNEKCAENQLYASINMIDKLIENDNLIDLLSYFNGNELVSWSSPIAWSVVPDEKNAKIYRCSIGVPQLTAYDYDLYIEDTQEDQNTQKYKKQYKSHFFKFVKQIFDESLGKNHGLKPHHIWEVENELMMAMGCDKVKNDSEEFYNIVKSKESLSKYGFDWEQFSKNIGFSKPPDFFICVSLNYLKCVMELLNTNWKTPKWRTYYIYMYLKQIARFHNKWRPMFFNFFGKFIRGQPVIWPQDIYPVFGLSTCFNTFLTNEYVKRNKKQLYINYVQNMANDLLKVFKRIINRNKWLSPKTKKYALLKLNHIKLIIGSPEILREDPLLDYSNNDPWGNMSKISQWRIKKFIELEGKEVIDIPTVDWVNFKLTGSQAYVVNAYYTPTQNSIYVPLAYLQEPFIDLHERGIEYNLAHVGYTLGHEMSHCLDDTGSKYDYKGNLKNWWTPHDRKLFNMRVNDVIKQYETFASYDGIKMDASLSTGENLADISGLAICEEYLRDFQLINNDIAPISSLGFQTFFVYIAIQDRQKIYDKAIKAQLKTNPHPMNKYRTNCPLARLKLFQSIYNIKKGDKMYWDTNDKTIW